LYHPVRNNDSVRWCCTLESAPVDSSESASITALTEDIKYHSLTYKGAIVNGALCMLEPYSGPVPLVELISLPRDG